MTQEFGVLVDVVFGDFIDTVCAETCPASIEAASAASLDEYMRSHRVPVYRSAWRDLDDGGGVAPVAKSLTIPAPADVSSLEDRQKRWSIRLWASFGGQTDLRLGAECDDVIQLTFRVLSQARSYHTADTHLCVSDAQQKDKEGCLADMQKGGQFTAAMVLRRGYGEGRLRFDV